MKTLVILLSAILIIGCGNLAKASPVYKTAQEKMMEAQKNKKSKDKSKSTETVTVVSLSPEKQYQNLLQRKAFLEQDIESINVSLPNLKKGQAKKATKRIESLQLELNAVVTSMSLFPKSITQKGYAEEEIKAQKEAFLQALALKTAKMIESTDPYSGQISVDKELEKSYRQYINEGGEVSLGKTDFSNDVNSGQINDMIKNQGRFYSVLFAIASQPIPANKYPYAKVYTQKLKNGMTAYFAGAFTEANDAQRVCGQILSKGQFRDSFVVLIK